MFTSAKGKRQKGECKMQTASRLRTIVFRVRKQWHYCCHVLICMVKNNSPQSSKVGSTATVLIISHITFGDCHVHIFSTTILEIAVYGIFITWWL